MAELTDYPQWLRPPKPSTFENYSTTTTDFSSDTFFAHQHPEFPTGYSHQKIHGAYLPEIFSAAPIVHTLAYRQKVNPERNSIKEMEQSSSRSKSISPAASTGTSTKRSNSSGRCKKGKNKEKEMDNMEEVVHVRAKRGQATDSHSIAERVRREKINSKLRCLQEIVPGCHKSMGIAVMLEEIINYVHSLQNQVEFLSMELAAASSSYVLNVDTLSSRRAQETNSPKAQELQKWPRERHGELNSCHYTTWSI